MRLVPLLVRTLSNRGSVLASGSEQVRLLETTRCVPKFDDRIGSSGLHPLAATGITVFQINVGKLCNQTCRHCHVDAGPDRIESMTLETAGMCITALSRTDIPTVDITGG